MSKLDKNIFAVTSATKDLSPLISETSSFSVDENLLLQTIIDKLDTSPLKSPFEEEPSRPRKTLQINMLVTGNGFDLAHNLPTKYMDFFKYCKSIKSIQENIWYLYFIELEKQNIKIEKNWINFESEISLIICYIDSFTQDLYENFEELYTADYTSSFSNSLKKKHLAFLSVFKNNKYKNTILNKIKKNLVEIQIINVLLKKLELNFQKI